MTTIVNRLKAWCDTTNCFGLDSISKDCNEAVAEIEFLEQQLAECQATNGKLRELCDRAHLFVHEGLANDGLSSLTEALALPSEATALNELIAERTASLMTEVDSWQLATANIENKWLEAMDKIAELTAEVERLQLSLDKSDGNNHALRLQNAELTAQRDAAMKDAERYQFLKRTTGASSVGFHNVYLELPSTWAKGSISQHWEEAIDAAIANGKEQK